MRFFSFEKKKSTSPEGEERDVEFKHQAAAFGNSCSLGADKKKDRMDGEDRKK